MVQEEGSRNNSSCGDHEYLCKISWQSISCRDISLKITNVNSIVPLKGHQSHLGPSSGTIDLKALIT